ncbi:MAG: hypothetical protein RLZZ267_183, partial [Bacillota bacterium]
MDFRFDIIVEYLPFLLKGALLTIGISLLSIALGSIFGLGVGLARMSNSRILRLSFSGYINFFRGTPLYVQILMVHFGLVPLFYGETNAIMAAVVA